MAAVSLQKKKRVKTQKVGESKIRCVVLNSYSRQQQYDQQRVVFIERRTH